MKKILLIEDELLLQKSLKRLLERGGASVTVTAQGKRAIEYIHQNNYHKIICDLMLQDISGFDVIEESKKKYSMTDISNLFIIITAYSSQHVLDKANDYGCKIISKPFDDINETIQIFLS